MKIVNNVRVAVPIAETWAALNDIPRVAMCAPGAELLEAKDENTYVGTCAVKLGPVALKFKGTVTFVSRDAENYKVVAAAQANEEKARGTARSDITFVLTEDGDGTRLTVESDVQLAGSIAQYGRGTGLIQNTAQVIMDQFAKNLEASLLQGDDAKIKKDIGLASALAKGVGSSIAGAFKRGPKDDKPAES